MSTLSAGTSRPAGAPRSVRFGPLLASLSALGAAAAILVAAGGPLGGPAVTDPSSWAGWAAGREPLVVAFSVVRVLAIGAVWYCAAALVLGAAARLAPARPLAALVDHLTLPPLRRLVAATVTVSLSSGALAAATASATPAGPPVTVTMHRLAAGEGAAPPTTEPPLSIPPTRDTPPVTPTPAPASGRAAGPGPPAAPLTWTVSPGQCFWSIAEDVVGRALGRRPSAADVVPYWLRLIEANRSVLADPHNPDLVFAGQVFVLPDVLPG